MALTFGTKESVSQSTKRIMMASFREALDVLSLSQGLHKEQFKQARKALKRARAALRLVRDSVKSGSYEREDLMLKEISSHFKEVRDVHVVEEVFQKLLGRFKKEVDISQFKSIQDGFFNSSKKTVEAIFSEQATLKKVIAELQGALERTDQIEFKGQEWKAVKDGLKDTYRNAYEAYLLCKETSADRSFVEWRKSVKYLRCQLDFLTEFLSSEFRSYNHDLHALSDSLGEYQDLIMMMDKIEDSPKEFGEKKSVKAFIELIEKRQKVLREECRGNGKKLFDLSPKEYIARLIETSKKWPADIKDADKKAS